MTNNEPNAPPITLVGAGLAGSLLAVMLARRGFRVEVYERFSDPRRHEVPAGRSINLALAERGRHALARVDLLAAVDQLTLPMAGRILHDENGRQQFQPYGHAAGEVIYSIHRGRLNHLLLDAAEAAGGIRIHFGHRLEEVDFAGSELGFACEQGQKRVKFEILIGADGAGSVVRRAMQDHFRIGVREELLDHGYKELTIPPGADGDFRLDPGGLHIWPRGGFMLIALPNPDRSFTATLFLDRDRFEELDNGENLQAFFRKHFSDVLPQIENLEEDFLANPVGLLGTVRVDGWHRDRTLLIGDAAHAVVPFHGQGMNAAFEDCTLLMETLGQEQDVLKAFSAFAKQRKPDANAIADLALDNYRIMRDAVRDPGFHLRKALEFELERRHPDRFVPRYSMVMFHRFPYSVCQQRGKVQQEILEALTDGVENLADVDYEEAARLIHDRLPTLKELKS